MGDLDKRAEEVKAQIQVNRDKKRSVYEGGKVGDSNITFKEAIGNNLEEAKKFREEKKVHLDKL